MASKKKLVAYIYTSYSAPRLYIVHTSLTASLTGRPPPLDVIVFYCACVPLRFSWIPGEITFLGERKRVTFFLGTSEGGFSIILVGPPYYNITISLLSHPLNIFQSLTHREIHRERERERVDQSIEVPPGGAVCDCACSVVFGACVWFTVGYNISQARSPVWEIFCHILLREKSSSPRVCSSMQQGPGPSLNGWELIGRGA